MSLTLSGKTIPIKKETKFLGVWLDKDLKWERQITEITNKVKLRQGLLKRGVNFLTKHAKKVLFFAQIQCVLSYGIGAWGNMINQTQQRKLQKTQNKCTRLIDTRHNMAEIRKKHNILSIDELTKLENYKLWYQEQGNHLPKGSCLGPLIFLIFCNDLNIHLENMQCIQFADDTTLYLGHPNPEELKKMIE